MKKVHCEPYPISALMAKISMLENLAELQETQEYAYDRTSPVTALESLSRDFSDNSLTWPSILPGHTQSCVV